MLEAGAQVNDQNESGRTALMYAVESNVLQVQKKVVTALLNAGADIMLKNKDGKTALMLAQTRGYGDKFLKLLRKYDGKKNGARKK